MTNLKQVFIKNGVEICTVQNVENKMKIMQSSVLPAEKNSMGHRDRVRHIRWHKYAISGKEEKS